MYNMCSCNLYLEEKDSLSNFHLYFYNKHMYTSDRSKLQNLEWTSNAIVHQCSQFSPLVMFIMSQTVYITTTYTVEVSEVVFDNFTNSHVLCEKPALHIADKPKHTTIDFFLQRPLPKWGFQCIPVYAWSPGHCEIWCQQTQAFYHAWNCENMITVISPSDSL